MTAAEGDSIRYLLSTALAIAMLACPASAELPWESEVGTYGGDVRPRFFFGVIGAGAHVGYHWLERESTDFRLGKCFAADFRTVDLRLFIGGTAGVGLFFEGAGSFGGEYFRYALPGISALVVTRAGERSFDYAELRLGAILVLPTSLSFAVTSVPFPPLPFEVTGSVGVCAVPSGDEEPHFPLILWFFEQWDAAWHVSFGVRVSAGWWVTRRD